MKYILVYTCNNYRLLIVRNNYHYRVTSAYN